MKKLFTLFAFLMAFMSASAVVVVDKRVDFTTKPAGPIDFGCWSGADHLSYQGGYLHFHSEEATTNPWDVQFLPLEGMSIEAEVTYTVEFKIKGSVAGPIWNMKLGGVDKYGLTNLAGGDQWETFKFEYTATNSDGYVLFQCGSYVGDWDMEYMQVSHEEREQKPVEWANTIVNGDAEGEYGEVACLQSKTWNSDPELAAVISPAEITTEGDNHVFVCHSKAVNPPLLWDSDGEQWGTQHSAGDPMPDNAWQNQMWLTFPRPLKDGEQVTVKFRYKASKAVKVDTQNHRAPGDYLGGSSIDGSLNFTTQWQSYEKKFSAAADMQSIAFNLGAEVYDEDIDFYMDDIELQEMVLEKGFFVAGVNNNDDLSTYDYDNAIKFEYNDDEGAWGAVIGTKGDQSTWVNELMISTVRGNDKAFTSACIKPSKKVVNDAGAWDTYSDSSKAKIKLPALGVWQILIDDELGQINFVKLEGEEEKEPIEIVANPTVVTINAVERNATEKEVEELLYEPNEGEEAGQPWDNQFCIMANRNLEAGEVVKIKFSCRAEKEAIANTQCGGDAPGAYIHYAAIGDVEFTTEWVEHEYTYKVPSDCGSNMASLTFNLAVMKEANTYEFKDIVWCNEDEDETLIDMEGTSSFFIKIGAGTAPYQYGTDPFDGITSVTSNTKASNATFNLAGQRVSKNFKGVVVKNGSKFLSK